MTTKAQILKTIRAYCIVCSGGEILEVSHCTVTECELYEYRMGKDPHPARSGPKVLPWLKKNDEGGDNNEAMEE